MGREKHAMGATAEEQTKHRPHGEALQRTAKVAPLPLLHSAMKIGFIGAGKQAQAAHLPNYGIIDPCQIAGRSISFW